MRWFITLMVLIVALSPLAAQEAEKPEPKEPMKVRFEERKPFIVAGVEAENAMDSEAMAAIWAKFISLRDKIPEPVGDFCYGIHYTGKDYDPKTMKGSKYFVGMEIKEPVEMPEELLIHKVPGGYYAVFEYIGSINDIGGAYGYIFGEWLASSGFIPAMGDMFEFYGERYAGESEKSVVEIWLPVQKRAQRANPEDTPPVEKPQQ
ncbi:MAG TPA: GyrI-like domain-containing protein [Candidatus Cloacimonadota bacterium]|nr:GyrI-like domain-containing protein [Candidatus Cloacimonadota bacterium]